MINKLSAFAGTAACVILCASTALAGALGDPIVEAPVDAPVATDWQGPRIGLTYSDDIDSITRAFSEGTPFLSGANANLGAFGGFVGYDMQRGNVVFGIEVQSSPQAYSLQGNPTAQHSDLQSLRARIGYTTGKTLYYGSFGAARSLFASGSNTVDLKGEVYGIGIERKIGKNSFVGLEIDHYNMSGENIANALSAETEQTVVQLRIGFVF